MSHLTIHKHRESSSLRAYYLRAYKAHSTGVERTLQIHPFLCKTNPIFRYFSPKTTISPKNKPNSKPIQTQFWPNFKGGKANSNPNKPNESHSRKVKSNAFAWIRILMIICCDLLAKTYHPIRVLISRVAKPNKANCFKGNNEYKLFNDK
jgi:hypothetical protein